MLTTFSPAKVFNLDKKELSKRTVEYLDIGEPADNPAEDASRFVSKTTGRGPLLPGWQKTCKPLMCAYKQVHVTVPYFSFIGSRIESYAVQVRIVLHVFAPPL